MSWFRGTKEEWQKEYPESAKVVDALDAQAREVLKEADSNLDGAFRRAAEYSVAFPDHDLDQTAVCSCSCEACWALLEPNEIFMFLLKKNDE